MEVCLVLAVWAENKRMTGETVFEKQGEGAESEREE